MDKLQRIAKLSYYTDPDKGLEERKKISRKRLRNTLNHINFQTGTILINFKHLKYDTVLSLQANPQPCLENSLECLWIEPAGLKQKLSSYKFLNFLLTDDLALILVEAALKEISEEGISFSLPEICYELSYRKVRRHLCKGIQVDLIQNSVIFYGTLLNFSAVSFCIEVSTEPSQPFHWVNPEDTVYVTFKNKQDILYSGECRIIRQTYGQKKSVFIVEPVNDQIRRFKTKEFRSSRHKLSPSPNINFIHPFTQKLINMEVEDLTGSGFSVEEDIDNAVLLVGMIIPELYIEIGYDFKIRCKSQVVNRNVHTANDCKTLAKCGMTVLDMDIQEQVRLSSYLQQAENKKAFVCNRVDIDALWKFFFETGFIYPKKYALMSADKEKFKATYEKLYVENPHIARHFVCQDKGIIQAHVSIIRFYEETWLLHNHASLRSGHGNTGLVVMRQVERYINDFHRLYSAHMNFVGCYFRPDNKFPMRVFGGCAREINNPKACSVDSFVYFCFPRAGTQPDLPEALTLTKTQPEDLLELETFYEYESGGLMLQALDLTPEMIDNDNLSKEFNKLGFKRERILFSLKKNDVLRAVIAVNVSDIGLNLSNLTNCFHVIILDAKDLPVNIIYICLSMLSKYYEQQDEIPVLLYPVSYAQSHSVAYEKIHTLWMLNTQYGDQYFKYMENLFHHRHDDEEAQCSIAYPDMDDTRRRSEKHGRSLRIITKDGIDSQHENEDGR
ncbi:pilus assembly protein PilZ [Candidatus Methylomirabilis limnetica]|uniref:Pilus assembly protein PilZ n=1 Tax=Candidatus Methylomirabilis limnetica TaxID=2033718 RepID=A0A2T4TW63_9BACT|nr:PilZ domain-containing protein [Candidatus Methylomirabilis limnetica]PTL35344.1 pilus assembly protein PilZ [Candidatus Methylomirabilis limnetica]